MNSCTLIHHSSLVCVALAAAAGLLGSSGTLAAERAEGTRNLTLHYTDVDRSSPDGAVKLYGRIEAAARFVCGERGRRFDEQSDWNRCYRAAIRDAVLRVDSRLLTTIYHRHQGEAPFTAMLRR
ncbi:MAG TPA: UrcA family protein [Steroidobacteraceae bacterium]|jgi:UrcA family protein|nr:UrcA family protein [Steroidobacteraceae bacterium]